MGHIEEIGREHDFSDSDVIGICGGDLMELEEIYELRHYARVPARLHPDVYKIGFLR